MEKDRKQYKGLEMKKLNKLKEYREKNKLSKEDLAYILDMTPEGISKIETISHGISGKDTYKLSKLYNVTMEEVYIATLENCKK